MITIEKLDKIYFIFKNLLNDLKCENEDLISFWWNEIVEKYTKKWKYYHNINHIYSFIELYNKYNNLIESNKYEFLISIFFHDIIYIPSRNDNEKESIKVFNKFNDEIKSNNLNKDKVIEYIKETENHLLEKDYQNDINLFLDMDMYIIADKNWEDYENKIRNEYNYLNFDIYKNKRKEFLLGLTKKKKIFRTKIFYNEYEEKARENINNLLKQLS
jgi:predicted metal-dependent HD superfamily phosphohydrolase